VAFGNPNRLLKNRSRSKVSYRIDKVKHVEDDEERWSRWRQLIKLFHVEYNTHDWLWIRNQGQKIRLFLREHLSVCGARKSRKVKNRQRFEWKSSF